jgi:hypothetical protein
MGNTFGENKREAKPLKRAREKKVGKRKLDLTEMKIANWKAIPMPIPIRATKANLYTR